MCIRDRARGAAGTQERGGRAEKGRKAKGGKEGRREHGHEKPRHTMTRALGSPGGRCTQANTLTAPNVLDVMHARLRN
eukprot:13098951-Alexandrium_andersonii.AAC.1